MHVEETGISSGPIGHLVRLQTLGVKFEEMSMVRVLGSYSIFVLFLKFLCYYEHF